MVALLFMASTAIVKYVMAQVIPAAMAKLVSLSMWCFILFLVGLLVMCFIYMFGFSDGVGHVVGNW